MSGTSSNSSSFWQWRRPKFTNTGQPTDVVPTNSAAEALCDLFGDQELCDITLQGSDGGQVSAIRAILAARSTQFRSKFFGEAGKSARSLLLPGEKQLIIYKEWDCRVLHLVVEYCYTDSCAAFESQPTEEIARLIAHLRVAARAFRLPGLDTKVKQWGWRQINRHPALACAMIDEGMRRDDIDDLALQTLQLKPRAAMLPGVGAVGPGILALSKPGLLFVLRTLEETTSHMLLLNVIERWTEFSAPGDTADSPLRERRVREAFGRKCALRFIRRDATKLNLERAIQRSKLFQERDDLATGISSTMALLDSGLQFSRRENSNVDDNNNNGTSNSMKTNEPARPYTAIGLVRLSMEDRMSKQPKIAKRLELDPALELKSIKEQEQMHTTAQPQTIQHSLSEQ
mmetsp:Transcript_10290/g.14990  ORF Transcript_10290/g.14990 Transcript_10290/m.14990 type:complete len:401 (-) Transcript_10290:143-1345(-)